MMHRCFRTNLEPRVLRLEIVFARAWNYANLSLCSMLCDKFFFSTMLLDSSSFLTTLREVHLTRVSNLVMFISILTERHRTTY